MSLIHQSAISRWHIAVIRVRVKSGVNSGFSAAHTAARAWLEVPPGPLTAWGQSVAG